MEGREKGQDTYVEFQLSLTVSSLWGLLVLRAKHLWSEPPKERASQSLPPHWGAPDYLVKDPDS